MEQQNTEAEIEQRIEQLKKITRKDGDKEYAEAQYELGRIYYEYKKDWKQTIEHLLHIKKQDDPEIYGGAQLILGTIYHNEKHDIEQAERYNLNVKKQDNPEAYALAQLYLGIIYEEEKDNIEQAERYYLNVNKQDNPKVYAQAQFNLGVIYRKDKNDIEKAEHCYLNIEKQDNPKAYTLAQLNLGVIYEKEKHNIKQAERYYLNVKKQDYPKVYAFVQLILGDIYREEKNDIEKSEHYYLKVEKQDYPMVFAFAQCRLGDNVFYGKTENKLKSAEEYYQNVVYYDDMFEIYIIAQMMLSVISNKDLSIFEEKQRNDLVNKICNIRKLTIEIQKELLVKFNLNESKNNDGLVFERQVAHYTKPEVLFNLLKNKPSDFRLNVVDFMNDPTENQVLTDWVGVKTEKDNEIKTFLASFSFNHNSLNQFRLYGNENNIVGSSVSVVFNQEFFSKNIEGIINSESINSSSKYKNFSSQQNVLAKKTVATMGINVSNKSLNHKNDKTENDLNENSVPKNSETMAEKNITSSVGLLPLFRCLYFDPKNGYISIAKRNKYSFFLEHQSDSPENIDAKWNAYLHSLNEEAKISTIRKKLKEIEKIVYLLKNPKKTKQKKIIEKITNLDQLIALALMPISCLVKHAAFEDEDECRMIYITNIADDLIQAPTNYAYANSLFVNYGKIEDYIEKIYLGPQCQPHHKLWITNHVRTSQSNTRNKPIKVVQSEMPLR
ncbi:sel1 repeat family protein [Gilliamella apicola]|uniref:Sel1 repeat family protein n=1 Tax=Gilliamella apicola TaxID=1196095 RepID=A0A556RNB2_9GAMM|nr:tetratricopeptide repeat protein [Gilliamella apicola]TSJ90386.1 sel1 repeat family protein [Gilliamella apicola]